MPPFTVENLEALLIFPTEAMMYPFTVSPTAAPAVLRRTFPLTVWASVSDEAIWLPLAVHGPADESHTLRQTPVKSIFTSLLTEFN